jgi:hypothetical protein
VRLLDVSVIPIKSALRREKLSVEGDHPLQVLLKYALGGSILGLVPAIQRFLPIT